MLLLPDAASNKLALLFFPSLLGTTPFQLLEHCILGPLELYESIAILPVSFLRRHLPLVGGTLVVLMALHGILMRLFLEVLHAIFARITYSRDPVFNYRTFWLAMRDRYAFFDLHDTDWGVVHQLFGAPLRTTTNEDDLWIALQESIALCDDPALRVTRSLPGSSSATLVASGRTTAAVTRHKLEQAALSVMERRHLTDGGRQVANHFVYGILNAETSPGWRIGYIALSAMDGFVDFPLPRVDTLLWSPHDGTVSMAKASASSASSSAVRGQQRIAVPEIYDLESMRWALEAILRSLGDVDGLVLDLRFNPGGGSLVSALSVASFFTDYKQRRLAFMTDEKLPGTTSNGTTRFTKKRKYYVPRASSKAWRYTGPLAILQSQHTRGTAELLALALMDRPKTCRIGTATAGSLTQTRKLRLPNYWTVDIPNVRCFSADGVLYEGRGIPADETVEQMEDGLLQARHASDAPRQDVFDPCIKKAIEHIMHG